MATPRSLNPFRLLATNRNFRLFWAGQTLSLVGTWMQSMAQGWLALELTNSALVVGAVSAIGSLPIVFFSLPAGALVDRTDKLRLVRAMQSLLLLEAALLWWFTWSGHLTIGWLLALALFNGVANAFEIPARQAMMIDLVGRDELHAAIALNSSGFNLARIIGPAIGAIVIRQFGIAWCFGLNALSYLAVLIGLALIVLPAWTPVTRAVSPTAEILAGLAYMRRTPAVAAIMLLVIVFSVLGIPYLTLMPIVARDILHLGASGYGLLLTFVGVGGLTGALFLASAGHRVPRGRLLALSAYAFPVLLIALALVRSPALAHPVLFLVGFMMIVNNALANSILQAVVDDAFRGRVLAAYSFVVVGLSQLLGAIAAGSIAQTIGADWAIGGSAMLMIAITTYIYWRRPVLARL